MANEIYLYDPTSSETLYATVQNSTAQMWNGSAWETLVVANWTTYDIAMTETPASSYNYVATFPTAIASGYYTIAIYRQAGASPAITDERLKAYQYNNAVVPASLAWSGAAAIYTPATLYSALKIIFGANSSSGATDNQTLIKNALKSGGLMVYQHAWWPWREVVEDIVTANGINYVAMDAEYAYEADAPEWLENDDSVERQPSYVSPGAWATERARIKELYGTSGVPRIWTFGMESIASVQTPVWRGFPTPDAIYTFKGLRYMRACPTIDETSADAVFPNARFDMLWHSAACAYCLAFGLVPVSKTAQMKTVDQVGAELESLAAKLCALPALSHRDMRYSDDLAVQSTSSSGRRDSDGNLLLGGY